MSRDPSARVAAWTTLSLQEEVVACHGEQPMEVHVGRDHLVKIGVGSRATTSPLAARSVANLDDCPDLGQSCRTTSSPPNLPAIA